MPVKFKGTFSQIGTYGYIFSVVNKYEYEDISVPNQSFENLLGRKSQELEDVCEMIT